MVGTLTAGEEAQLAQTIEMFEVITQSQPQDYQSLEILKEAYAKLGRDADLVKTSKRIANAYVLMGQLSSAILEYESILQRFPEDAEALTALNEIESKASGFKDAEAVEAPEAKATPQTGGARSGSPAKAAAGNQRIPSAETDDGRQICVKLFVDGKIVNQGNFDQCWPKVDFDQRDIVEPFIQVVADKGYHSLEKSLRIFSDKTRLGYLPLDKYDIDYELTRQFAPEICKRWCILPFDRLSKSILVATANPFNRQAIAEMEEAAKLRVLWYLSSPPDIIKALRKAFRS
ncbi:MAG TPA: hypothetical protein VGE41_02795 [Verrucomicrobiae bacterium]